MFSLEKLTSKTKAAIGQEKLLIMDNRLLAKDIFELKLHGELVEAMQQPGQFVHVKCGDGLFPLLRRPFSICDVDLNERIMTIIYRVAGEGTKLLSSLQPSETLDVIGPLGNGFPIADRIPQEKVLLIGGGVGVPPLYYLSNILVQQGVEVVHRLGFSSASEVFYESLFTANGQTVIMTDDGSHGQRGRVTDGLQAENEKFAAVYACGPVPMLQAVGDQCAASTDEVYLSVEKRMGCGIGACLACVLPAHFRQGEQSFDTPDTESMMNESTSAYHKVCCDGPVFRWRGVKQ